MLKFKSMFKPKLMNKLKKILKMKKKSKKEEKQKILDSSQVPVLPSHYYGETSLDCMNTSHPLSILEISERDTSKSSKTSSTPRKMYQNYRGQLQLCIDIVFGNLTVHVIRAKHLSVPGGAPCGTFVRVSMAPSVTDSTTCYSDLICDTTEPIYDEKFTYELIGKDLQRRVQIKIFSRVNGTNSLIGCMSFGIGNIAEGKTVVDGWYYILTEELGEKKHMCVRDQQSINITPTTSTSTSTATAKKSARFIKNRLRRSRRHSVASVESSSSNDSSASSSGYLASCSTATDQFRPGCYPKSTSHKPMKMMTVPVLSCHSNHGYGFSLSEGCPCKISKVEGGSAAFRSGLREGDVVVRVNGQSVHRMYPETVGRIIKHYPRCVVLDILRHSQKVPREVAMSATCQFLRCLTNDSDQDTSEDELYPVKNKDRKLSLGYVQLDGHPEMIDPSFCEPSDKPVFHQTRRYEASRPVNQVGPTLKEDIVKDLNENVVISTF